MLCLKCLLPLGTGVMHYGLHEACFCLWFNVGKNANFQNLSRKSAVSDDRGVDHNNSQNNSFFHGKFKKYSASLEGSSYILKMKEPEAPELPEVEYLCNQIGVLLGVPVAEFFVINFGKEIVFVTKNCIVPTGFMDLQHIYHFRKDSDHNCKGLIRTVEKHTKRPYDINILINTILYDALIGNHDRHGRNLAFIVTSNQIVLSPIYDNVSYLSLEKGEMLKADFNPTGKISTQATFEPNMRDYVIELRRLGYAKAVELFLSRINQKKIMQLIENSFCSSLMKNAMKNLVNKRAEELKSEL